MKRFLTILLTVVFVMAPVVLNAETYKHQDGGISIWFPDNWKINTEENMLEATAPDDSAYAHLLVMGDVETLDAAVEAYGEELDAVVENFQPKSEGEMIKLNGMDGWVVEGTGIVEGVKLEVGIALLVTQKAIVMIMTFNTPEAAQIYGKDFSNIINSIKPI